jgi:hypothetical protein
MVRLTMIDRRAAARRLRRYFRDEAQHGDDCTCECCKAVEVLAAIADVVAHHGVVGAPPIPRGYSVNLDAEPQERPRA